MEHGHRRGAVAAVVGGAAAAVAAAAAGAEPVPVGTGAELGPGAVGTEAVAVVARNVQEKGQ